MKKIILTIILAIAFISPAQAYYYYDSYSGMLVSNVCRYGNYWQYVSYNYVGTSCYMSGWGVYGTRSAE